MNPLCRDEGLGLLPWSPLARGLLAGNRRREGRRCGGRPTIRRTAVHRSATSPSWTAVTTVAEQRGVSNAEVALAWLLHQPNVVAPIVGATKIEHVDAALRALDLKLDAEEMKALNASYQLHGI